MSSVVSVDQGRRGFILLLPLIFLLILSSCQKEAPLDDHHHDDGTLFEKVHLHGIVQHHDRIITDADIYFEPGATSFPGKSSTEYSQHIHGSEDGTFVIDQIEAGIYYFYAIGWDAALRDTVYGGIPVFISGDSSSQQILIPVTE
ncbi:MAG: hypothetical protein HQ500_02025 [Flavobacteriales bacterium]|nr:hypothetical protein [Flavobacteriales bacterium]